MIPDDCQRGAIQVLRYVLSKSLWLCCAWPTDSCSKDLTLCIATLHFLDANKVLVSTVWFSPTMQARRKPGMMPHATRKTAVYPDRGGVRWEWTGCCFLALRWDWFMSLHTRCRHVSWCSSLTPFSNEAKHWALLGLASIKQSMLTFLLKEMPDVFGLHLSNLQRQQLQREHTAHMLHPPAKCICHKAQHLLNFSDRLRQKKK